jgi:transposase
MQRNIRVLVVEPNMLPYEKVIPNRLKDKQELVGGNIEYTRVDNDESALLICNEEGKILGLPYNRDIGHDVIAGTFIMVGDDPDIGEDRSLTDEQVEKYKAKFDRDSIEQTKQTLNKIMSQKEFEL